MIRKGKVPNGLNRKTSNNSRGHEDGQPIREHGPSEGRGEYSHTAELINNLPYLAMIVLGTAVLIVGFQATAGSAPTSGGSVWGWIGGGAYLIYGLAGALWIIVFVCPYCRYWGTRACPCGYGRVAAKLREKKAAERFNEKFKKHIPVIIPLWLIPVFTGAALVIYSFSWVLLVLLIAFVLNAFVVLPLLSVKHGCRGCPQKGACPWMGREASH